MDELENKDKDTDKKKKCKKVSNEIDMEPTLNEEAKKLVVFSWGRWQPPTNGHEILVNKVKSIASKEGGTPIIYLSHTQDTKGKNPLDYATKLKYAQKAFGKVVKKSSTTTIVNALAELSKKYTDLVLVVGDDQVPSLSKLVNGYNGKDFTFDSVKVVSSGTRTEEDMAASKLRAYASQGKEREFIQGLPSGLKQSGQEVYNRIRRDMKITEEMLDEAPLTLQQRFDRRRSMRKNRAKINVARKRVLRKRATAGRIARRSRRGAIDVVRSKVLRGKRYSDQSIGMKRMTDERVAKRKAITGRITRQMKVHKRASDARRLRREDHNTIRLEEKVSNIVNLFNKV